MKKLLIVLGILTFTISSYSQQKDVKEVHTKMDAFASKTGVIIKFVDYSLPNLSLTYGAAETKIRKLISGGEVGFFYQISYKGKYGTKTASIAYEDLVEVIKALNTLKVDSETDKSVKPDYLENKFVTDDGFQLGYYVSKGKLKWYLVLEKYGSATVFINELSTLENAFNDARLKIEELKS